MKILTAQEWLSSVSNGSFAKIAYSTSWQGFVEDSRLMRISFQDHMVHRGDAVFEAIKVCASRPYLWDAHWSRLHRSAESVGIQIAKSGVEALEICQQMIAHCKMPQGLLRVFASRGEGGFGVNPYECSKADLHIFFSELKRPSQKMYETGARIMPSSLPAKDGFLAQIKSCNYLINVLMKKEALDNGFDFAIGVDSEGFVLESSTENLVWINSQGVLEHPPLDRILAGTSMKRLFELVAKTNLLPAKTQQRLSWAELEKAQEVFLLGTTIDVLPVGQIGKVSKPVGPWARKLLDLLLQDQQ